jgi:TatD family-associated radical SAM protein
MDTYIYKYGDAIYINLTNKCTNSCTFCIRNEHKGVEDYDLWLKREPEAREVISQLERVKNERKFVFCGFGEPTMRLGVLLEVAKYLKGRGANVRLNTNGQGSAYAGHNIAPSLRGLIDKVSISLNAPDAAEYQRICRSVYGEESFSHMLEFARCCIAQGIETVLTVVDVIGEDEIEKSRKVAESVGAKFRVRQHI